MYGLRSHQKSKVRGQQKARDRRSPRRKHRGTTAQLGRGSPLRRVGPGSESSAGSGVAGKGGDKPPRCPRPRLPEPRNPGTPGPGSPGPTRAGERDSGQKEGRRGKAGGRAGLTSPHSRVRPPPILSFAAAAITSWFRGAILEARALPVMPRGRGLVGGARAWCGRGSGAG